MPDRRYPISLTLEELKRLRRHQRKDAVENPEDDDARRLWFKLDAFLRRHNVPDGE
jgi:hypothetical protein